ncbi:MAG: hypothetical protein KBG53_04575, partial [Desulfobulbus sp.]|nr:hypothetical protein [Desulfobulbus sp.]
AAAWVDTGNAAIFYHHCGRVDNKNSWPVDFDLHTIFNGCLTILDNHLSFSGFADAALPARSAGHARLASPRAQGQDAGKTGP